jgi:hypothetical protein
MDLDDLKASLIAKPLWATLLILSSYSFSCTMRFTVVVNCLGGLRGCLSSDSTKTQGAGTGAA